MKIFRITFTIAALATLFNHLAIAQTKGDIYQINIYHTSGKSQIDSLDQYLQNSYLPQLHNTGIRKIGVFYPIANDTSADKRIVLLIPLNNLYKISRVTLNSAAPKYKRLECILLSAFPDALHWQMPELSGDAKEHVYELRSYESATEERHIKKVEMFNKGGEVKLFRRLSFNAVFYARVIVGSRMPNLMYMTSFDDMAAHDAHWKSFTEDPEWKRLSALPEYANTVQHIDITLMHAAEYSDIR